MSGSKSKTPQTQTHIAAAMSKATRKGATLDQIVATVRREHPELEKIEGDALINMSMKAIARRYGNLRPGSSSNFQPDFFDEYPISECVTIPVAGKDGITQSVLLRVDHLTIDQGKEYVAAHKRTPKQSKRIVAMERAIRELSPFGTGASTFGECWKASKAAGDLIAKR